MLQCLVSNIKNISLPLDYDNLTQQPFWRKKKQF